MKSRLKFIGRNYQCFDFITMSGEHPIVELYFDLETGDYFEYVPDLNLFRKKPTGWKHQ